MFTQNVFIVQLQTLFEVIQIFVQFHCLSSYRNDLYWNDFVSKGQVSQLAVLILAAPMPAFDVQFTKVSQIAALDLRVT